MRLSQLTICLALLMSVFATAQVAAQDSAAPPPPSAQRFADRFNAANTTHDGHLTLLQAQVAGMPMLVRRFSEIDSQQKGYITLLDVRAWRQQKRAARIGSPQPQPSSDD